MSVFLLEIIVAFLPLASLSLVHWQIICGTKHFLNDQFSALFWLDWHLANIKVTQKFHEGDITDLSQRKYLLLAYLVFSQYIL